MSQDLEVSRSKLSLTDGVYGGWIYVLSGNYIAAFALMLALSLAATRRTPLGAAAC